MRAVSSGQMSEIDIIAQQKYGIPSIILMENAGRSVFETIKSDFADLATKKIAVFCGKGNNGGDGFVIARYLLKENPRDLRIYMGDHNNIKTGASEINFCIINNLGINVLGFNDFIENDKQQEFDIIIDAVFGIGFKGDLPDTVSGIGNIVNEMNNKIFSVDVPSGLNASTGEASVNCFKAFKTITFGLPKKGFYLESGPAFCGEVVVKDIGFPEQLLNQYN